MGRRKLPGAEDYQHGLVIVRGHGMDPREGRSWLVPQAELRTVIE